MHLQAEQVLNLFEAMIIYQTFYHPKVLSWLNLLLDNAPAGYFGENGQLGLDVDQENQVASLPSLW